MDPSIQLLTKRRCRKELLGLISIDFQIYFPQNRRVDFFHHVLRRQLSRSGECFRNHSNGLPPGNRSQKSVITRKSLLLLINPDNWTRDSSKPQAQLFPSRSQGRSLYLNKVSKMTKSFCLFRAHQYQIGGK